MDAQKIEFRKIRSTGDNLSTTFAFFGANFKSLAVSTAAICGVFIISTFMLQRMAMSSIADLANILMGNRGGEKQWMTLIQYYISFILSGYAIMLLVISYIKAYIANDTTPSIGMVWAIFWRAFVPALFLYIIEIVLVTIGFVFLIVPGVWLMTVLAPLMVVFVMENCSFSAAFNRCFRIIKENFWQSMGTYLAVTMLFSITGMVVGLITGIITGTSAYLTPTAGMDNFTAISTVLSTIINFVFYMILTISITINYFSLVETCDAPGMLKRLDSFGKSDTAEVE